MNHFREAIIMQILKIAEKMKKVPKVFSLMIDIVLVMNLEIQPKDIQERYSLQKRKK
jgi:hypothetical protein